MGPSTLMIVGGALFVIFMIITLINFAGMTKNMSNAMNNPGSFDATFNEHAKGIGKHAIFGVCSVLSGLVFVGGLVWFLIGKFA